MHNDMILVLDFGAQQGRSIARKVRGEQVYCEVLPYDASLESIQARAPRGIILAGGTMDAFAPDAIECDPGVFDMDVPVLGMGYGARLLLRHLGGRRLKTVLSGQSAEIVFEDSPLFAGLSSTERYFERLDEHELPEGVVPIARTGDGLAVAFACENRYGTQFYAEQNDPDGFAVLRNFAQGICGCEPTWTIERFIDDAVADIRERMGDARRALIAISGGVDSAVCAALMHRAIGDRLCCLHVDTGLMREGETEMVMRLFRERMDITPIRVDASERFLNRLAGVYDPDEKRRVIDEEFLKIFQEEAHRLGDVDCLVQGTIYNDVLEADGRAKQSMGMVKDIGFGRLIEPVRRLFKEEVRQVGTTLGLPVELVGRQAFPGPGLAVRCMGEVTAHKLRMLRKADAIYSEAVAQAGLDRRIGQYFAVLTDVRTRDYSALGVECPGYTVALRAVNHLGAMSANAYRLPYDLLERVVERITSEVEGVNRVVYDITGKPPASIEWE